MKDNIVFGFLDTLYIRPLQRKSKSEKRKDKGHTLACFFPETSQFDISAYYLIHNKADSGMLKEVIADMRALSPKTKIQPVELTAKKNDDLADIYTNLSRYFNGFKFKTDAKHYYLHLSSGSPLQQLAANRLAVNGFFPGNFVLSAPSVIDHKDVAKVQIVSPDWYRTVTLNAPPAPDFKDANRYLKAGIETKDVNYNALISCIENIAVETSAPLLFTGPEGSGKCGLITRLYELKRQRGLLTGKLLPVNCTAIDEVKSSATLIGSGKDAFPDASSEQNGLFIQAYQGMLFLDDIGELTLKNQAILLAAIEQKRLQPIDSPTESISDFQLVAGTSIDLRPLVREGKFREDLFARLCMWTFHLPALRHRPDDLEPNLDFELRLFQQKQNKPVRFKPEARDAYVKFARMPASFWPGNFYDLSASVTRMATLAHNGWIDTAAVVVETAILRQQWGETDYPLNGADAVNLADYLQQDIMANIDDFDIPQLKHVVWVCQQSRSAADAGRRLFNHSRKLKSSTNDTSRLAKYLSRFELQFQDIAGE